MPGEKCAGAICGGDRQAARKTLKENGHCDKHKKFKEECKKCMDKWLDLHDSMFMALM